MPPVGVQSRLRRPRCAVADVPKIYMVESKIDDEIVGVRCAASRL